MTDLGDRWPHQDHSEVRAYFDSRVFKLGQKQRDKNNPFYNFLPSLFLPIKTC